MPRYCAAFSCKNRRGRNNKDRKLSFYPFPLHDKERLEKWLRNMKRDTWVPSKYQFLCSDHFTPDSLDIRWGIRYLKQTAVPTIFSLPEDSQEKDHVKNNPQGEKVEDKREICLMVKSEELSSQMEPKKNILSTEKYDGSTNLLYSSSLSEPLQKDNPVSNMENLHNDTLTINSTIPQHIEKPKPVLETAVVQDLEVSSFHTSLENLLNTTTATLNVSNPEHVHLSVEPSNIVETAIDHFSNPDITDISVSTQENTVLLSTITQTIEELNTDEESVITILVPTESSKPESASSFVPIEEERIDVEDLDIEDSLYDDTDYGIEILQTEHSYCRQDINRELLWQKVTKLHSKITLLELQEQQTLGRLKSLETLIGQLKQENLLSEEKLKIVENCFTTFEVTMIE